MIETAPDATRVTMTNLPVENPAFLLNREMSWLAFNRRVLEEAEDESNPLLERIKFLSITASNLDEFFEVRLAGLVQQIEDGHVLTLPDGITLLQQRDMVAKETHDFLAAQYRCWNDLLHPALAAEGIRVLEIDQLDANERAFVDDYCDRELDPLLTPVTIDPSHPFPRVINKALCLAFLLKRNRSAVVYTGVVTVPRALPRLVRLPSKQTTDYIFLADLVAHHAKEMYKGYEILASAAFRATRNSNLYVQEEESRSLLELVRSELHNRRKGDVVRLEIEAGASPEITDRLQVNFDLEDWQVFRTDGPVNLSRLMNICEQTNRPDLKFRPFAPRELRLSPKTEDLFEEIRRNDILLHHPYDSYEPVVALIESAAEDARVLSIKQTLYRTGENSRVVPALIEAATHKEVTAVVELRARFDEASNIRWARELEDAGVQVFHGVVGLKTHCKLALLVRRDPDGTTRRYAHLGTGNYNSVTARFYTDLSLMTADPQITNAVSDVFAYLTAYSEHASYEPLLVSPLTLSMRCLEMIEREAEHARAGRPARIIAKMNSLLDKNTIHALYRASQAGVEIDLIIRGICALRPGIPGVSERIRVRSIVGRFLEHSRIYLFANGGNEQIYAGSADWMHRNLYERVEVLFPVREAKLRKRLREEILAAYLADTKKARVLTEAGVYLRAERANGDKPFSAQDFLIALVEGKAKLQDIPGAESVEEGAPKPEVVAKPRSRRAGTTTKA